MQHRAIQCLDPHTFSTCSSSCSQVLQQHFFNKIATRFPRAPSGSTQEFPTRRFTVVSSINLSHPQDKRNSQPPSGSQFTSFLSIYVTIRFTVITDRTPTPDSKRMTCTCPTFAKLKFSDHASMMCTLSPRTMVAACRINGPFKHVRAQMVPNALGLHLGTAVLNKLSASAQRHNLARQFRHPRA